MTNAAMIAKAAPVFFVRLTAILACSIPIFSTATLVGSFSGVKSRHEALVGVQDSVAYAARLIAEHSKTKQVEVRAERFRELEDTNTWHNNAWRFIVLLKHADENIRVLYNPAVRIDDDSRTVSDILQGDYGTIIEIKVELEHAGELFEMLGNARGDNLVVDPSFEEKRRRNFDYSQIAYSGSRSVVLSKSSSRYRDSYNTYPEFQEVSLRPGTYVFGGYYKIRHLRDYVRFEVVDSRGPEAGAWTSISVLAGTADWTLLEGRMTTDTEIAVRLRAGRIGGFTSGAVWIDDIFFKKLKLVASRP